MWSWAFLPGGQALLVSDLIIMRWTVEPKRILKAIPEKESQIPNDTTEPIPTRVREIGFFRVLARTVSRCVVCRFPNSVHLDFSRSQIKITEVFPRNPRGKCLGNSVTVAQVTLDHFV